MIGKDKVCLTSLVTCRPGPVWIVVMTSLSSSQVTFETCSCIPRPISTVFLDRDLRIRKFTPAVTSVIKLLEHDVGRPIDQISYAIDMEHDELLARASQVLKSGKYAECDVTSRRGFAFP